MKVLTIDEMIEVADQCGLPELGDHIEKLELAASGLAVALAKRFGIANVSNEDLMSTYELGCGGLCANFGPAFEGQPCPEAIDKADPGGDWREE